MTSLILNQIGEQYISRKQIRDPYERLKKWLRYAGEKVQYINEDEFENIGIEEFGIEDEDIEREHIAILKKHYNLKHGDIVYTRNRDSYIYIMVNFPYFLAKKVWLVMTNKTLSIIA